MVRAPSAEFYDITELIRVLASFYNRDKLRARVLEPVFIVETFE